MKEKELVEQAAKAYGFNLEYRAKGIFEQRGCVVETNKFLSVEKGFIEIDIFAKNKQNPTRQFVVECKGTHKDSYLILIKDLSSKNHEQIKRASIKNTNYRVTGIESAKKDIFCTFSGDFFSSHQSKLKKISKNDSENNLYKAQEQLLDAISAISKMDTANNDVCTYLTPIIITNAKIWVVDYSSSTEEEGVTQQYKWVFHKIQMSKEVTVDGLFVHAIIINVEFLDEFVKQTINMNISEGRIVLSPEVIQ